MPMFEYFYKVHPSGSYLLTTFMNSNPENQFSSLRLFMFQQTPTKMVLKWKEGKNKADPKNRKRTESMRELLGPLKPLCDLISRISLQALKKIYLNLNDTGKDRNVQAVQRKSNDYHSVDNSKYRRCPYKLCSCQDQQQTDCLNSLLFTRYWHVHLGKSIQLCKCNEIRQI